MSFIDWYYPQPVTTPDQADDELDQIVEDGLTAPSPSDTGGGGTSMSETGVARTFGQGPDIDIGALSVVPANAVQFTDFNDYLSARGLPRREGFFSGTDFSSLGSQSNLPGAKTMSGIAGAVSGSPMLGFVAGVFSPTREVMDPTGTSSRYIHESGIFNTIASMNIAEEFSDLGAIKDAYEKNPNGGSKQNGIIMHMNGRPIYRTPGSAYYKHKIPGLGEISQLQGQNLEKLALAPAAFETFKAQLLKNDGNFEGGGTLSPKDTFISTPNGGYNLDGTFNFGGQTSAAMGYMEDKVSLGNQMFDHVTDENAKAQAAARTSYATAVIEGLRSLPSNATSAQRTAVIQNVMNMSRNMTTPTSILSKAAVQGQAGVSRSEAEAKANRDRLARVQANQYSGGDDNPNDYGGSGVEDAAAGSGAQDFETGLSHAQGGKIRGYAPGGEVSSDSDDAADDDMGDVATMDSSYSADPDSFSDEDAGMYDGGNDDSDVRGSDKTKAALNKDIRDNIVSALQNRSLTPDQRRQVNQLVQGSTPSIEELDDQKGFVSTPSTKSSGTSTFGNFLEDTANAALQAGFLQALGMAIGFNYGGTVKNKYAEGDMITGEQSIQEGEPVLTANEVMEGTESGFIQAKPSQVSEAATVADDVDMRGDVGGEIINASAVVEAGEADIAKMIEDARNYARQNGIELPESKEKSDIRVSKGEAYIEKELVPIIGRDKIRKINNRGKKDTRRKIKETQMAAEGGFIKKKFAEGDTIKGSLSRAVGSDQVNVTQQDAMGFMPTAPSSTDSFQPLPSTPLPKLSSFEREARDLLEVLEDNRTNAYIPKGRSKSGATIGIGFDIGQHNVRDLRRMGFSSDLIEKLTPYTMKKGTTAKSFLKSNPLSLNERQVEDINTTVIRKKYEDFSQIYPEYSEIRDAGKRAVMFSAFFGGGLQRYKTFRNEFDKAQNVEQALKKGLINIVPRGAAEHNRAKKALNWYRDYGIKVMPTPTSKPRQNPSATR
jgi:hypothetical protein